MVKELVAIVTNQYASIGPDDLLRRVVAGRLQELELPLDLSGIDLTGTTLHLEDLTEAIWTAATRWPNTEIITAVQAVSEEVSPGIYQVRTGTDRDPSSTLVRA